MIRPRFPGGPLTSQIHILPSSNGPTSMLSSSLLGGLNIPAPRASIGYCSPLSMLRGCCNQFIAIGAWRCINSEYQSTFSPGYVGSQFASIRILSFALDLESCATSGALRVRPDSLLPRALCRFRNSSLGVMAMYSRRCRNFSHGQCSKHCVRHKWLSRVMLKKRWETSWRLTISRVSRTSQVLV